MAEVPPTNPLSSPRRVQTYRKGLAMNDTNLKFKNINGVWITRDLFHETASDKSNVIYTLRQEDYNGYPSLYRLYMETNDVTEYNFAVQYLGGWSHWKALQKATFFEPYLLEWREELETRARSFALAKIIEAGKGSGPIAYAAQKFVANKEWDKAKPNTKGRPSNAQIKAAANDLAAERERLNEDLARLMN